MQAKLIFLEIFFQNDSSTPPLVTGLHKMYPIKIQSDKIHSCMIFARHPFHGQRSVSLYRKIFIFLEIFYILLTSKPSSFYPSAVLSTIKKNSHHSEAKLFRRHCLEFRKYTPSECLLWIIHRYLNQVLLEIIVVNMKTTFHVEYKNI